MLNILTPLSFKARWLNVAYHDTDGSPLRENSAILLEHRKRLAKRVALEAVNPPKILPEDLDPEHMAVVSLFMYMIGNTDFSLISGADDECCHNAKLFRSADTGQYLSIPYDFDASGFVRAPYREPKTRLRLPPKRKRTYRGFCVSETIMDETLALFEQKREALFTIATNPNLVTTRIAKENKRTLEKFYEHISDPEELEERILNKCRG